MGFSEQELASLVARASTIGDRLGPGFMLDHYQRYQADVESRLEQWCHVVAEDDWENFQTRLAMDALDLQTVRHALGCGRLSDDSHLPTWVRTFNTCLRASAVVDGWNAEKPRRGRFEAPASLPFEPTFKG